jgi:hypothetical protein
MSKRISELTKTTDLNYFDEFAVVQSSETKKVTFQTIQKEIINYLVPYAISVVKDTTDDLGRSDKNDIELFKLSWSGPQGNMTLTLPDATDSNNVNRVIRFISDSSFTVNTQARLTPFGSQTIDGSTNYYTINKEYEGVTLWSDGTEWFIIQKKA